VNPKNTTRVGLRLLYSGAGNGALVVFLCLGQHG
jgi:hypothetical protein